MNPTDRIDLVAVARQACGIAPVMIDLREIVGELRKIEHDVSEFNRMPSLTRLRDLLRRIDESEQQTTEDRHEKVH